ncbi:hypothetical protein ACERK3_14020 [Phycisphaerales bacterium AB-hyl4]|uniref:Uncharacterized protein n=1 Tax=Natronomicrosphaera hydrolytica TaxID=3242702 RepID=A0ABV4U8U6_9BACT
MARLGNVIESACPYLDKDDARCSDRFSLRRLEQAFHVCANGGHECCSIYHQLLREQQRRESNRLTITITVEGRQPPRPARTGPGRAEPTREGGEPIPFPRSPRPSEQRPAVALRAVGS